MIINELASPSIPSIKLNAFTKHKMEKIVKKIPKYFKFSILNSSVSKKL